MTISHIRVFLFELSIYCEYDPHNLCCLLSYCPRNQCSLLQIAVLQKGCCCWYPLHYLVVVEVQSPRIIVVVAGRICFKQYQKPRYCFLTARFLTTPLVLSGQFSVQTRTSYCLDEENPLILLAKLLHKLDLFDASIAQLLKNSLLFLVKLNLTVDFIKLLGALDLLLGDRVRKEDSALSSSSCFSQVKTAFNQLAIQYGQFLINQLTNGDDISEGTIVGGVTQKL